MSFPEFFLELLPSNCCTGVCIANILSHHAAAGPDSKYAAYLNFSLSVHPTVLSFLSVSLSQSSASIGSEAEAKGSGLVL